MNKNEKLSKSQVTFLLISLALWLVCEYFTENSFVKLGILAMYMTSLAVFAFDKKGGTQ